MATSTKLWDHTVGCMASCWSFRVFVARGCGCQKLWQFRVGSMRGLIGMRSALGGFCVLLLCMGFCVTLILPCHLVIVILKPTPCPPLDLVGLLCIFMMSQNHAPLTKTCRKGERLRKNRPHSLSQPDPKLERLALCGAPEP